MIGSIDELRATEIIKAISEISDISIESLNRKTRIKNVVKYRHFCIYFIAKKTNLTLDKIGKMLGGRHHSTVIYVIRKIDNEISIYKNYRKQLNNLELSISSRLTLR